MILSALMELAEREGLMESPDFQPMPVRWLVDIGPGGKLLGHMDTLKRPETGKGRPVASTFAIPKRSKRTTQNLSEFIIDKPEYVFGWVHPDQLKDKPPAKEGKIQKRAAERHDIYLRELRHAHSKQTDEGLASWIKFLEESAKSIDLPGWTEGDLIAPRYFPDGGDLLTDRPVVREFWSQRRRQAECGTGEPGQSVASDEPAFSAYCVVTGELCSPIRLHPSIKGIPPMADTKGGVPLTSINAEAFGSYGLDDLSCAPISQRAADAYQAALNRLLSDGPDPKIQGGRLPNRRTKLADDTIVVFWSKNDAVVDLFSDAVNDANPDAIEALYKAVWKGKPVSADDPSPFYALTLSGAQGRATVRGWHEMTLGAVLKNVGRYFRDLEIDAGKPMPLMRLIEQTAIKGRRGRAENIAPNLAGDVFQAILSGRPFPRSVLEALIRRTRAERTLYGDRAAFIKACLCRIPNFPEVQVMLDEKCRDPGYRLGRLFSLLEKLQEEAVSANATIRDRYYGAASATPVVVFPQLLRKAPHHLGKLTPGRRTNLDKMIQSVCDGLAPPTPFPSTLTLEQQGLFAIGYYHQRQALFTKREEQPELAPATQGE